MHSNHQVILKKLTEDDANYFYDIAAHPELITNYDESPFLPYETPAEFTRRIISVCEFIFTIRHKDHPGRIIGDCAVHNYNGETHEIVFGGSLLPAYWGMGLMQSAFELIIEVAKQRLAIKAVIASTKTRNRKAIRFAEKMGFKVDYINENETVMRKDLLR